MDKKRNSPPNTRKGVNFISAMTFAYTFSTFMKGRSKGFQEEDIMETLDDHLAKNLGDKLESCWVKEISLCNQPSLFRCIFQTFYFEITIVGFAGLFVEILKISQAVAFCSLLKHYTQSNEIISINKAYLYAAWLILASLISSATYHWYMQTMTLLGMKLRVACSSLLYRKSLRLRISQAGGIPIGHLTNFLSNDVGKLDTSMVHLHTLWFCPLVIIVVIVLLYMMAGFTSIAGVLLIIFLVPIQVYYGKKATQHRLNTALKTDERIRLMNEIIKGIQVIKMFTWEKSFINLIEIIRRSELTAIGATARVQSFISTAVFVPKVAIFVCILLYTLSGNIPNAEYVFTVTPFYNLFRELVTMQFSKGILEVAEACVSLKRLEKYLALEEVKMSTSICSETLILHSATNMVRLENVYVKWPTSTNNVLCDINFTSDSSQLVTIIGPIGSGKTTLLNAILGELYITTGNIHVRGKVSYAAQEPWIFSGSIEQNILLGKINDSERYKDIIRMCCLERDLKELRYGDQTEVGERGVRLSGGQKARINLARALYLDADIYLLDDPLSAVDNHVEKQLFNECIIKFLRNKCTILVTHQLQYLPNADRIYLIENGTIVLSGTFQTIRKANSIFTNHLSCGNMINNSNSGEFEEIKLHVNTFLLEKSLMLAEKERRDHGGISEKVYVSYFYCNKSIAMTLLLVATFTGTQVCASGFDYITSYWVNAEQDEDYGILFSRANYLYVCAGVCVALIILVFVRSYIFFRFCLNASSALHKNMLFAIINSPMQFFNENSSGRILNRFSKDMGIIDENVPKHTIFCCQVALLILGALALVAVVSPNMLIVTGVILLLLYFLRKLYVPTAVGIKRIEGITRSPIFAHVNASLQGLTTIRALKATEILENEFYDLQDLHSSTFALHVTCARAFSYYIEVICTIYVAVVIFTILLSQSEHYGGTVGLAITQALSINVILQAVLRSWTELESIMTSVERVVEYSELKPETVVETLEPSKNWPEHGSINFKTVSLKYPLSNTYALRNISIEIKANEKIGIVGRTGAGKSSLISALFQLTPTDGTILIDGVDIKKISFDILRSNMSIIPQQPVLFSGSLRKNLDPFDRYSDEELWCILEDVELKHVIANLPLGLNCLINESGANFSVGQRQLICLARAIICKNKILVLDEATSNIDRQSDSIIQKTIRTRFKNCTVLTVAHRLHTVIDADKIIVMDSGKVVEFDHPYLLLNNKSGLFYSMVLQLGEETGKLLITFAEETFKSKMSQQLK